MEIEGGNSSIAQSGGQLDHGEFFAFVLIGPLVGGGSPSHQDLVPAVGGLPWFAPSTT